MKPPPVRALFAKRLWTAAGAAALLLAGLGAWYWGAVRQRDDLAWRAVVERGVLVVATDATYPPFSAVDADGNLFGFDIDLAEALAGRLSARAGREVRAEFENLAYDALLPALVAGRDDAVISAFVAQPERAKEVAYTRPYFTAGTVAVIAEGDAPLASAEAGPAWAAGRRLAVEYGAGGDVFARQWARLADGVAIQPAPSAAEALAALAAGTADAALVDSLSAYDFLRGQPGYRLAGPPLDPEPYVVAVSARSRLLRAALDEVLAEMAADGSLAALVEKWFGPAAATASAPQN